MLFVRLVGEQDMKVLRFELKLIGLYLLSFLISRWSPFATQSIIFHFGSVAGLKKRLRISQLDEQLLQNFFRTVCDVKLMPKKLIMKDAIWTSNFSLTIKLKLSLEKAKLAVSFQSHFQLYQHS